MKEDPSIFETLLEKLEAYGKTSIELVKLKAVGKISEWITSIISSFVSVILIITFLLFLNFGIAIWLGEVIGKLYLGFLALAGFYGLLVIFFSFILNKAIKKSIGNRFVKQLLK